MGKEIHRPGLIARVQLDGTDVHADILPGDDEEFALALLEQYLQVNYPDSKITIEYTKWNRFSDRVKLSFVSQEDALHFYLSH
jgi:hypothetical protein